MSVRMEVGGTIVEPDMVLGSGSLISLNRRESNV